MENLFIQAVINEDVEAVQQLLQEGANPNMVEDADRVTPLHFVAQKNTPAALAMARLLLDAGADPMAKTEPDGQTPLETAKAMSGEEMVSLLTKAKEVRH